MVLMVGSDTPIHLLGPKGLAHSRFQWIFDGPLYTILNKDHNKKYFPDHINLQFIDLLAENNVFLVQIVRTMDKAFYLIDEPKIEWGF